MWLVNQAPPLLSYILSYLIYLLTYHYNYLLCCIHYKSFQHLPLMTLNGLYCADVLLSNYSLTHHWYLTDETDETVGQYVKQVGSLPSYRNPTVATQELRDNTTLKRTAQPSWSPTAHVSQMPLNCSLCAFFEFWVEYPFHLRLFRAFLEKVLNVNTGVCKSSPHHSVASGTDSPPICHLLPKLRTIGHKTA